MLYQPIRSDRGVLSEQVARQILDLITNKQLEDGERLPSIEELSEYLGVSRTSIREAIKFLESWGVVTVKHGVGTFVTTVGVDTLMAPFKASVEGGEKTNINLHQLREALEPAIAAIAAEKANSEHILKMENTVLEMDEAIEKENLSEFIRADLVFHTVLAEATGNPLFLMVIYPVIDLLQDQRRLAVQSAGSVERAQFYHREILEHIKAGQSDKAREAMKSHLNQIMDEISSQLNDGTKD